MQKEYLSSTTKQKVRLKELQDIFKNILYQLNFDYELKKLFQEHTNADYIIARVSEIMEDLIVNSMELKIQDLTQENILYMKEIQNLTTQINDMKNSFKYSPSSSSELKQSRDNYWKNEYTSLKEVNNSLIYFQQFDIISFEYKQNLEQSQEDIQLLENKLMNLQEELDINRKTEHENQKENIQEIQELRNKLIDCQRENEDLNMQLKELFEKELPCLEKDNKQLQIQNEQLSLINDKQSNEFEQALNDIQEKYEQKVMELQNQLDFYQIKKVEFDQTIQTSKQLERQTELLKQQVDELEFELQSMRELKNINSSMQIKLNQIEKELKISKRNNQELLEEVQKLNSLKKTQEQSKVETSIMEKQIKDLNKDLSKQINENKKLKEQNSKQKQDKKSQIEDLRERLQQAFVSIFSSLQLERESIKIFQLVFLQEIEKLQDGIEDIVIQNLSNYQSEIQVADFAEDMKQREFSEKAELLRNQLQAHFKQNKDKMQEQYIQQIKQLEQHILDMEAKAMIQINQKQNQVQELFEENKRLNQNQLDLMRQLENHQTMSEKDDILRQQQSIIGDLQKQIRFKEQEVIELEKLENISKNENDKLTENIIKLEQQLNLKQQSILELKQSKEQLKNEFTQLFQDHDQLEYDLQIVINKSQDNEEKIKQKCQKDFEQFKQRYQKDIDFLRQKLDLHEQKLSSLEEENNQLKKEKIYLEDELKKQSFQQNQIQQQSSQTSLDYYPIKYKYNDEQVNLKDDNKEYNMIIAKYRYEKYAQNVESKHKQRLENIKYHYQ